jgi:hypothetical protein
MTTDLEWLGNVKTPKFKVNAKILIGLPRGISISGSDLQSEGYVGVYVDPTDPPDSKDLNRFWAYTTCTTIN